MMCGRKCRSGHGWRGVIIAGAVVLSAWNPSANAQDPSLVIAPLSRAQLVWDNPVPPDGVSYADRYVVSCASESLSHPATGVVQHPGHAVALVDVLPGPGVYRCTVRGENVAGVGPASNDVAFAAGGVPGVVLSIRIEVR